jgi:VanZ family protein
MTIKTLLALKKFWLVGAVFWTGLIFYLCLVDSSALPSISIKGNYFDKIIHFAFHFIFSLLWICYSYLPSKSISTTAILKVIAISILVGIAIEILQGCCTTSRRADIFDVFANTSGAILSGILLYFLFKRNKLKTN